MTESPTELLARADALRAESLAVEATAIEQALVGAAWRVRAAAVALGLAHGTMRRRIARHPAISARLLAIQRAGRAEKQSTHVRTTVAPGEVK